MTPVPFKDELSASKELINELKSLKNYEDIILRSLEDKSMAELYVLDPGAAFKKMGIEISPKLEKKLEEVKPSKEATKVKTFVLPNGQTVTPHFTIKFTRSGD